MCTNILIVKQNNDSQGRLTSPSRHQCSQQAKSYELLGDSVPIRMHIGAGLTLRLHIELYLVGWNGWADAREF